MALKVYLVFYRVNVSNKDQPHEKLIGARLNRHEAEDLRDLNPGSYIHKVMATKAAKPKGGSNVESVKPNQDGRI